MISACATSTARSGPRDVDQQRHELVTAAAADQAGLPDDVAHATGDDRQHLVADAMPVAVVQQPEVVEVDEQQRAALVLGVRTCEQPCGAFVEGLAIRELREAVDGGETLDPFPRVHLLGNILPDAAIAAERPVFVEHRVAAREVICDRAVRHAVTDHHIAERVPLLQRFLQFLPRRRLDQFTAEIPRVPAEHVLVGQVQRVMRAALEQRVAQLLIHLPVPVRRQFGQGAEAPSFRCAGQPRTLASHIPGQSAVAEKLAAS